MLVRLAISAPMKIVADPTISRFKAFVGVNFCSVCNWIAGLHNQGGLQAKGRPIAVDFLQANVALKIAECRFKFALHADHSRTNFIIDKQC